MDQKNEALVKPSTAQLTLAPDAAIDLHIHTVHSDGDWTPDLEVYHPAHTPEQVALYRDCAQKHHLLISSVSDSHGPKRNPIKYRAELSRDLLERVGIQVK